LFCAKNNQEPVSVQLLSKILQG